MPSDTISPLGSWLSITILSEARIHTIDAVAVYIVSTHVYYK